MSFTAKDLIRDVIVYWNRPAESTLAQDDLIAVLNRKINRLFLLMQLTDRNYLAVLSQPFSYNDAGQGGTLINLDNMSVPVRVESRQWGADENSWTEETIADYGAWNDVQNRSINAVAFYGSLPDDFRMAVNRDAADLEFRILYETGGVSLANFSEQVPVLQDLFKSAIFYGVAAEAGMMMDGLDATGENSRDKKVSYAVAQETRSLEDFKKWLLTERGQSVEYRESFNSERPYAGLPRMANGDYYSRY